MATAHYAIDFLGTRPTPSPWAPWCMVLGVAAAIATGGYLGQRREERQTQEQTLARLQMQVARESTSRQSESARVPSPAERRWQSDMARLSLDLHRPWFEMADALESSAPSKVGLQSLTVDSGFSRLQLQVEAPNLATVLQYVNALQAAGSPLQSAQLLSHEWLDDGLQGRRLQARIQVPLSLLASVAPAPSATTQAKR